MTKRPLMVCTVLGGIGAVIWLSLSTLVPKSVPVVAGGTKLHSNGTSPRLGLQDGGGGANEIPESNRHAAGEFQKNQQLMAQRNRRKLQTQIEDLLRLQGDQLMICAAGIDLPNNAVRTILPGFQEAKRDLEGFRISGLGNEHPVVKSQVERIDVMERQLNEEVVNLRNRLKAQLELLPKRGENRAGLHNE